MIHLDVQDYLKSVEYQKKSLSILRKNLQQDDMRIKDAEILLEKINKAVEERIFFFNTKTEEIRKNAEKPKIIKRAKDLEGDEEKENQEDFEKIEDTIKFKV